MTNEWRWLSFRDKGDPEQWSCISHAVRVEMRHALIADLGAATAVGPGQREQREHRGFAVRKENPITKVHIDFPGMVCTVAPIEKLHALDGLVIEMWCDEVERFGDELRKLEVRRFLGGVEYFKLKGHLRAIVMTPEDRFELLNEIAIEGPVATARARKFYESLRGKGIAAKREEVRQHTELHIAALDRLN